MSNLIFLTIKGSSQGFISKGATSPESVANYHVHNHEDEIIVKSFEYGASNQAHPVSRKPVGLGRTKPFVIKKMIDKSSPLLYQAQTKGETLTDFNLKVYRTSYNGKHEHYLTIALEDARISHISLDNHVETIYFVYKSMNFEHIIASTVSKSVWQNSPVVYDGELINRLVHRTIDNFNTTNKELYNAGAGVLNAGTVAAGILSVKLSNDIFNSKHMFIKNHEAGLLGFVFTELFVKKRFKVSFATTAEQALIRVLYPMIRTTVLFELGVGIGSALNAGGTELYLYIKE